MTFPPFLRRGLPFVVVGALVAASLWVRDRGLGSPRQGPGVPPTAPADPADAARPIPSSSSTGRKLGGLVVSDLNRPVEGAAIVLEGRTLARTERDGYFVLVDPPGGDATLLRVWIVARGFRPAVASLGTGQVPVVILVPSPVVPAVVVEHAAFTPVRGARVELSVSDAHEPPFASVVSGADGTVALDTVPTEGLDVQVRGAWFGEGPIRVPGDGSLDDLEGSLPERLRELYPRKLAIRVRAAGRLAVTAREEGGAPVEGVRIVLNGDPAGETDRAGELRIAEAPPGEASLAIEAEGWLPESRSVFVAPGETTGVDLILRRGSARVHGRIAAANDLVPVRIEARDDVDPLRMSETRVFARVGPDGAYELPVPAEAGLRLVVWFGRSPEGLGRPPWIHGAPVRMKRGERMRLDVQPEPVARLVVKTVDPASRAVSGAAVGLRSGEPSDRDSSDAPGRSWSLEEQLRFSSLLLKGIREADGVRFTAGKTDARGFSTFFVAPGRWIVRASHPDHVEAQETTVEVKGPRQDVALTLAGGLSLLGRVVTAEGEPARGFAVACRGLRGWALSGPDGRFSLSPVAAGPTELAVYLPGLARIGSGCVHVQTVQVVPSLPEVEIRLPPLGGLRGRVRTPRGSEPDRVAVTASPRAEHRESVRAVASAEGEFRMWPLPPGEYDVHLQTGSGESEYHGPRTTVVVQPGRETWIELELPAPGTVSFTASFEVKSSYEYLWVRLTLQGEKNARTLFADRAAVESSLRVAPGTYEARILAKKSVRVGDPEVELHRQTITVTPGLPTRLQVPPR